ncbi:hypothetical protein NI359_004236 [Salmonella enterica]|nr:hypothetical protein [Salmonella enterica]EJJ4080907.1 hypothetical protein [Salmonella enterica]
MDSRTIVIFGAELDIRLLRQTAAAHKDAALWLDASYPLCHATCCTLNQVVAVADIDWSSRTHSAVTDARMTAAIVKKISTGYRSLMVEI